MSLLLLADPECGSTYLRDEQECGRPGQGNVLRTNETGEDAGVQVRFSLLIN